jgi:hypothetical protein
MSHDAWLRRLTGYCLRHRGLVALALGGSLIATLAQAALPLIMAWIVDDAVVVRRDPIWVGSCLLIAAGLIGFAGVYTGGIGAASCRSTCSTTCAPSCSSRSSISTGPARISCTPARSSAGRSPT